MPLQDSIPKDIRKLLSFGTGIGIQADGSGFEVAAVRVRPSGIQVLGRCTIADYAERPAAEWGGEYESFLKSLGVRHLSATVLLPRKDVIVRQVALPGVDGKDLEGAIRFQLDTLHPYGQEEIEWGWSPLAFGTVLVGIARREVVERYHALFTEAGIAVASFTFSAAALHAAVRLNGAGHGPGFVALSRSSAGGVEVYGESPARPVFSAEFEMAPQRAAMLALSELRLPPSTPPQTLEEVLPKPAVNPVANDLSRNALPYATALAGACPRLAPSVNVLPARYRRSNSRAVFIPTLVLAVLLLMMAGAVMAYSSYAERRYLAGIHQEIAQYEPQAQRAGALDRQIAQTRARAEMLDQFRRRTQADLDALNELTRLIAPPAWTNNVVLTRDMARISGEAPDAAPLLRILDASPLFANSAPDSITKSNSPAGGENFQIHTSREGVK
jgi:hypothetical protein